ncbi:MAG: hypothetical protein D6738_14915 [Acidobacteria bacterium]|nr:MAG: hypothetical protein D6738_14915 [Acidobacteriota bacterium]
MFDLDKLLTDVFRPEPGEIVTVAIDEPRDGVPDNAEWVERREMAEEWRQAFVRLGKATGFEVRPLLAWPATGANNADLPARGRLGDEEVDLEPVLASSTLVVAMTEFSATAPLAKLAERNPDFRAASMPGVLRRMERTALAADYAEVARRCQAILERMRGAELVDVTFSTGHRAWFDLRHRTPEVDDGYLPRGKPGDRIINLPSGETFCVPYEGERDGIPSWTAGSIPVREDNETVVFRVAGNRIVAVDGPGPVAARWRAFFEDDPVRANVAEVAFGVNEAATVTGNVLEDEKAGFHWAFGRSDHLGGVVGVGAFRRPETVIHQDIVYARGNPIGVERAVVRRPDGTGSPIIENGEYVI